MRLKSEGSLHQDYASRYSPIHVPQGYGESDSPTRFSRQNLSGQNFAHANLSGLDFTLANLSQCDLRHAQLHLSDLRWSNLRDADLTDATGIMPEQFAGADLAGARLPPNLDFKTSLDSLNSLILRSRTMFMAFVAALSYTLIAVWGVPEGQLLVGKGTMTMPLAGIAVDSASFFKYAPWVIISASVYVGIYMQQIWERTSLLPFRLPDGTTTQFAQAAWFPVSAIIRAHTPRHGYSGIQISTACWLAYLMLHMPLTVTLFSMLWKTLPLPNLPMRLNLLCATVTSLILAANRFWTQKTALETWRDKRPSGARLTLLSGTLIVLLIIWTTQAERRLVAAYQDLTPGNSNGGALLMNMDLTKFSFAYSHLPRSNFSRSTLDKVWLIDADANNSRFSNVTMRGARLDRANLSKSVFAESIISADFFEADLSECRFDTVALDNSDFVDARLDQTEFKHSSLSNADLRNIQAAQINLFQVCGEFSDFEGATISDMDIYASDFSDSSFRHAFIRNSTFENVAMRGADLGGATIQNVSFTNTDLSDVNFADAWLIDVEFSNTELIGAEFVGTNFESVRLVRTGSQSNVMIANNFVAVEGTRLSEFGHLDDYVFQRMKAPLKVSPKCTLQLDWLLLGPVLGIWVDQKAG